MAKSSTGQAEAKQDQAGDTTPEVTPECFVIMPISDQPGYREGHFRRVYNQIFKPACEMAGFRAVRDDEVGGTNVIQLDVLQRLLDTPLVLCDLSTRNPNVLFELGLRQAFDKPVALVKEVGTPPIFDVDLLRFIEYRNDLYYDEVLEDQQKIAHLLKSTWEAYQRGEGVNSLVKLLSLPRPAAYTEIPDVDKNPVLQLVRAEIHSMRTEFRETLRRRDTNVPPRVDLMWPEAQRISETADIRATERYIDNNGLVDFLSKGCGIPRHIIMTCALITTNFADFLTKIEEHNSDPQIRRVIASLGEMTNAEHEYRSLLQQEVGRVL